MSPSTRVTVATARSAGRLFQKSVQQASLQQRPMQIVSASNAYSAKMAQQTGASALYLQQGISSRPVGSGGGMLSFPGISWATSQVPDLPLMASLDSTNSATPLCVEQRVQEMDQAGIAAIQLEDVQKQEQQEQQSNDLSSLLRPSLIPSQTMVHQLETAVETRTELGSDMILMARTNAMMAEGLESTIDRVHAYVDAGADMICLEACSSLEQYRAIHEVLPFVPIMAKISHTTNTIANWNVQELGDAGVSIVMYPLSSHFALTEQNILSDVTHQRRDSTLYGVLNYQKKQKQTQQE